MVPRPIPARPIPGPAGKFSDRLLAKRIPASPVAELSAPRSGAANPAETAAGRRPIPANLPASRKKIYRCLPPIVAGAETFPAGRPPCPRPSPCPAHEAAGTASAAARPAIGTEPPPDARLSAARRARDNPILTLSL
ncbi:MAG: hypothetical protein Kow0058_10820 [Roseovarius sp.]